MILVSLVCIVIGAVYTQYVLNLKKQIREFKYEAEKYKGYFESTHSYGGVLLEDKLKLQNIQLDNMKTIIEQEFKIAELEANK